jgi:hypothetical protein
VNLVGGSILAPSGFSPFLIVVAVPYMILQVDEPRISRIVFRGLASRDPLIGSNRGISYQVQRKLSLNQLTISKICYF